MRAGGPAAYCGNMGHADQLLIVGTLGHVQGVQLLSEYIGAESTVSTHGQGSSCLLWVHGGRGASSLQWVHGGNGAWVHEGGGPAAYSGYMGARGPVA